MRCAASRAAGGRACGERAGRSQRVRASRQAAPRAARTDAAGGRGRRRCCRRWGSAAAAVSNFVCAGALRRCRPPRPERLRRLLDASARASCTRVELLLGTALGPRAPPPPRSAEAMSDGGLAAHARAVAPGSAARARVRGVLVPAPGRVHACSAAVLCSAGRCLRPSAPAATASSGGAAPQKTRARAPRRGEQQSGQHERCRIVHPAAAPPARHGRVERRGWRGRGPSHQALSARAQRSCC